MFRLYLVKNAVPSAKKGIPVWEGRDFFPFFFSYRKIVKGVVRFLF